VLLEFTKLVIKKILSNIHPVKQKYWLLSAFLLGIYVSGAVTLSTFFPFPQTGPGDFSQPSLKDLDHPPRPGLVTPRNLIKTFCIFDDDAAARVILIEETSYPLYAVYCMSQLSPIGNEGLVSDAALFDATSGEEIIDADTYRQLGLWKYYATLKSPTDWIMGGFAVLALTLLGYFQLRERSLRFGLNEPSNENKNGGWVLIGSIAFVISSVIVPCITVPVGLLLGGRSRMRAYIVLNIWLSVIILIAILVAGGTSDFWALFATIILALTLALTSGFGYSIRPEVLQEAFTLDSDVGRSLGKGIPTQNLVRARPAGNPLQISQRSVPPFRVVPPDKLPNFSNVGGMDDLKKEIRDTIGLMLAFRDEAEFYKISWNGFLLHGPPGAGKTFIAQSIAGEFGINFIPISPSELTSSYLGESARLIMNVFDFAHDHVPCLLFFDEFDSLAAERESGIDPERRLIVNQLLRSLEDAREERELIVAAATNDLGRLDPAVIRPGRFDYHLHIGYPDQAARRAILASQLAGVPTEGNLDLEDLASRLDGSSAADIASIVRKTALDAFRSEVQLEDESINVITQERLLQTIANRSGRDRPKVGPKSWDELILPSETKAELIEIEKIIENMDLARSLGLAPPTGILLHGPPGTGKTTIANVLASETRASFYHVSAADILTKWFGESERNIRKLFERAQRNRPSIVFIDELDALAPRRTGLSGVQDAIVNQLLNEIDGMSTLPGVFVIGATNRPDTIDPALLRGGRLSRQIYIPLPDAKCRGELLMLLTARMPLAKEVSLSDYVMGTEGFSGADIESFCQLAAQKAFNRIHSGEGANIPVLEKRDFDHALIELQQQLNNRGRPGDK